MSRVAPAWTLVVVLAVMGAACIGDAGSERQPSDEDAAIPRGGTLEIALLEDLAHGFDPAREWSPAAFELFHCCLLRTLLAPTAGSVGDGGMQLRPDLAADMPQISVDGLTYVFEVTPGIRYAPPMSDVEITADDFVRALRRLSDPDVLAPYAFYFSETGGFGGIVGFDDANGGPIAGVKTPDDDTLVITLSEPAGDFPWRMSLPGTAPIPPKPDDPEAPFGIAEGHNQDFGRFVVGAGPYMIRGAEAMDLTGPAARQAPAAGYEPGRSIAFDRSPSSADDDLRPAYVDAIEVQLGGTPKIVADAVDAGEVDLVLDARPLANQLRAYLGDEGRSERVHINADDTVHFIALNVAQPPFDDVHVRRAASYALDKASLRRASGGDLAGSIAGHLVPPTLLDGQLEGWDPYATPNAAGDVSAAKDEMAQSSYDGDGDGVCDADECRGVVTIVDQASPYPEHADIVARSWRRIGIELEIQTGDRNVFVYERCVDPSVHWGVCPSLFWPRDYPDPATFARPLLGSSAIGPAACCNFSLVGAPASLLEEHGYAATHVPGVEEQLSACSAAPIGEDRLACWAGLDRTVMEDVVPVIPWLFGANVDVAGERLANYTFDQATGMAALDHLAVRPEDG